MTIETVKREIPDDIVQIWQGIVNLSSQLMQSPSVMINRLNPPELEVFRSNIDESNPFPSGTTMPMEGVYCEYAARMRQMVKVVDARKDPQWSDSPTAKAGIYAYLGLPLFWPDGKVFGTICTVDTKEHDWSQKCNNLLHTFKTAIETNLSFIATLEQLRQKNSELETAITEIKTLRGLLPICTSCKKIRDDKGYWNQIEVYFHERSDVEFSHGFCPDCIEKYYPEFKKRRRNNP